MAATAKKLSNAAAIDESALDAMIANALLIADLKFADVRDSIARAVGAGMALDVVEAKLAKAAPEVTAQNRSKITGLKNALFLGDAWFTVVDTATKLFDNAKDGALPFSGNATTLANAIAKRMRGGQKFENAVENTVTEAKTKARGVIAKGKFASAAKLMRLWESDFLSTVEDEKLRKQISAAVALIEKHSA